MTRRILAGLTLSLLLVGCPRPPVDPPPPVPPPPPVEVDELDQPLPLYAAVKRGTLDNGLTYYVFPHEKPEKRAQLWLAVNAGSVLEDEDQRGLAHFVEHMGFNGTKRFPKHELIELLEKSGVRFGADLNAYTNFDETVYTLQVPTDQPELVDKALSVLRDWADAVSFEPDEVEKERGVVLEEWRLGRGARMRLFDKQAPVLFHGSRYGERITIGKPEIIRGATRDTLVRFYRDWYRPDLMAVIAVGDFDGATIEKRIRSEFASLAAPPSPRPRQEVEVPAHRETLVSIETDREMPTTSINIMMKIGHRPELSARDYRRAIGEQLYSSMLNARLDELRRDPSAPFLFAGSSTTGLVRSADVFRQTVIVKEDGIERGLGAVLEEIERVERHGFTSTELERAKLSLLRGFEVAAKEHATIDGAEYAAEITRHFFEAEAMPGREGELALAQRFVPTFELPELNQMAKAFAVGSTVITVTGPDTIVRPTPEALLAVEKAVTLRDIKPYVDAVPSEPLLAVAPAKGAVVDTKALTDIGVTEWTLANGVHVVAKPTEFKRDEVRMTAFSPGGTSLVGDADYVSAEFADEVVAQGGLGPFDAVKLRKSLAGKVAWVRATIAELEEGLSGGASANDIETMLELTYLSFTKPREDVQAFSAWRTRALEDAKNRALSPERLFQDEMLLFANQNHARRQPTTTAIVEKIDLDKAMAVYAERFADAGDFTFVFVGNLDLERLKGLTETYLGSLPTKKRKESWRDVKVAMPTGVQTKVVEKGSEPKSVVTLTFHGAETWTRDNENDLKMLVEAMRHRLRQILREELGGVYGVQVSGDISRRPRQEYRLNVSFGCAPDNVDKLKQAVFDELEAMKDHGVADEYLVKMKESRRRAHEVDLKDNGYWLRELERAYTYGDDPTLIVDIGPMIDKISSDRVRDAAKKYANPRQYVLGVLKPAS